MATRVWSSSNGDRCCCGGCSAHDEVPRLAPNPELVTRLDDHGSGRRGGDHLGPEEPGQFSSDGSDDDLTVVFAGVESPELGGQALLGGPGAGQGVGMNPDVAFGQGGPDQGSGPVGPGRLDQLGPQVGVPGMGDPAPSLTIPEECSEGTRPVKAMIFPAVPQILRTCARI